MAHPGLCPQQHPQRHVLPFGSLLLEPFAKTPRVRLREGSPGQAGLCTTQTPTTSPGSGPAQPPPRCCFGDTRVQPKAGAAGGAGSLAALGGTRQGSHQGQLAASAVPLPRPAEPVFSGTPAVRCPSWGTRSHTASRGPSPLELRRKERTRGTRRFGAPSREVCTGLRPPDTPLSPNPPGTRARVPPTTREASTPRARNAAELLHVSKTGEV